MFSKSDVRDYTNERGAGRVASLVLVDASGKMKCVMFSEQIDRIYNQVVEGKVCAR